MKYLSLRHETHICIRPLHQRWGIIQAHSTLPVREFPDETSAHTSVSAGILWVLSSSSCVTLCKKLRKIVSMCGMSLPCAQGLVQTRAFHFEPANGPCRFQEVRRRQSICVQHPHRCSTLYDFSHTFMSFLLLGKLGTRHLSQTLSSSLGRGCTSTSLGQQSSHICHFCY
jgi:hypothetical protein